MKVAFRVDSSYEIGSGHVMRCLTIADMLRERGTCCDFYCRSWPGNIMNMISKAGHNIIEMKEERMDTTQAHYADSSIYKRWLGKDEIEDARDMIALMRGVWYRWVVVDHYGISHLWENAVGCFSGGIAVIDDLANRRHRCSILLDPGCEGHLKRTYKELTSGQAKLLVGPKYALLRKEFIEERKN